MIAINNILLNSHENSVNHDGLTGIRTFRVSFFAWKKADVVTLRRGNQGVEDHSLRCTLKIGSIISICIEVKKSVPYNHTMETDDNLDSFHLDIEHDIEQIPMRRDEADMTMPPFNLLQQEDTPAQSKMSSNQHKKRKKRRSVSDDDDDDDGATATFQSAISITDLEFTINQALEEKRIDQAKTDRLNECLQAGDWSEIALSLLTEQIPKKRRGIGPVEFVKCLRRDTLVNIAKSAQRHRIESRRIMIMYVLIALHATRLVKRIKS